MLGAAWGPRGHLSFLASLPATGAPSLHLSLPVSNAACWLHHALLNTDKSLGMQLASLALKATKSGKADLREAGSANSRANASHASHASQAAHYNRALSRRPLAFSYTQTGFPVCSAVINDVVINVVALRGFCPCNHRSYPLASLHQRDILA